MSANRNCQYSEGVLELVGLLYDAATDPARWQVFLIAAAKHFGAFGGNLIRFDPDYPDRSLALLTGFDQTPVEVRGERMQALVDSRHVDPRLAYSFAHPNRPFHCRQILTTAELHASPAYREMLRPHGVEYSMMVTLVESGSAFTGLGFQRNAAGREFSDVEVADLGRLVPHLRRALAIQDGLGLVDYGLQASYEVLEGLSTGIAVVDAGGAVEYANHAARECLARQDGVSVDEGILRAYRRNGLDLLGGLLREVAADGEQRALVVERPSGRPAYRLLLSRLWQRMGVDLPNLLARPRVVCYLSDPDRPLETSVELLQRLFGLTPGEARLVQRIVAGETIRTAAEQLRIRESTARDRLKGVFKKTETASQADLIRAILSSPAWLAAKTGAVPGYSGQGESNLLRGERDSGRNH